MKKLYTAALAAAIACTGVQAQMAKAPFKALTSGTEKMMSLPTPGEKPTHEQRAAARKAMNRKAPAKRVAGPTADDKLIDETPAGTMTQCVKSGFGYGYNWLVGLVYQNIYNGLTKTVVSEDGTKLYIQNPIYFNYASEENWIVGDISGDEVTFTFPQLISVEEYFDDEGNLEYGYYDYALKLEFVVTDPDSQEGWYYPCEDQTYKFKLNEDGSLTSLEQNDAMIGMCAWFGEDEVDEGMDPHWSWQGNGDFVYEIKPLTEEVQAVPDDVTFSEWQYLSDISSRPVMVGFKDDNIYVKGFYSRMSNAVVVGTIEGDKVSFPSGQYMGMYEYGGTTVYFLGGHTELMNDEYGEYTSFILEDNITFNYDKDNNILQSEGAYCISSAADKVLYYVMGDKPYICIPAANITVKSLLTPQMSWFYDVDEDFDWDAEFYFYFPTIDADHQILPKDRLFYQVIMDNEVFTFYDDEYELPEGVSETTDIPYGYESMDTYDFGASGTEHSFIFHTRGFESLGVRTLYKPETGDPVYSGVLWAPGYEGTFGSVSAEMTADRKVSKVEFFDLNGMRVKRPANGVYVKRTTLGDGTTTVSKMLVK